MLHSQHTNGQTTPSNPMTSAGRKDVPEKELRQPMLIARNPFPDAAVETDMMKRTLPPSTRSSTHPSNLTSSHPPMSSSAHSSSVSSHSFVYSYQSSREQPTMPTGSQSRPYHPGGYLSASQPLQRSFSQHRSHSAGQERADLQTSGVYSTEHAQKAVVSEPMSVVGQRRYSVGQMTGLAAVSGPSLGPREQLGTSGQYLSGGHGPSLLQSDWMSKSGPGPSPSGEMGGGVAGGDERVGYISNVNSDPRHVFSGYPSINHSGSLSLRDSDYDRPSYSSLDDITLLSLSNPAPSRPPISYPPTHHHTLSHQHIHPPVHHAPNSHFQVSHHQQLQGADYMTRPHPQQLSDSYLLTGVPTRDFQSLDTLPSHTGNVKTGHQRQPILLPPSLSSSGNFTSISGRRPYVTEHAYREYQEGGTRHMYGHEVPMGQYQAVQSAPQHTVQMNQGSRRLGGSSVHHPSSRPILPPGSASQLASSIRSLDDQVYSGDSQPRGQSCFLEDQPMSLQVEERLSLPDSWGSASAPSSLQSPSHQKQQPQQQPQQQRKRPEHLQLDDYLAGQTQKSLTLREAGEQLEDPGGSQLVATESIEITEQPRDATVKIHQKAVFTCKALLMCHEEGKKVIDVEVEPQLQWFKGDVPLANEVMKDLILCDVKEEDADSYHCTITHPHQPALSLCSSRAVLTVKSSPSDSAETEPLASIVREPVIRSQPPLKMNVGIGEELRLVVEVEGEEPINFKWYKDLQQLDYCHKNVLRISSLSTSDSGQYSCSVSNMHGSLLTKPTLLRVVQSRAKPSILVHPYSQQLFVGQELFLSVETDMPPHTCSFQWYKDHARLEGQTGPKLIISCVREVDAAEYYCSISNAVGMVDSDIAFISVRPLQMQLPPSMTERKCAPQLVHGERLENVAVDQYTGHHLYMQRQQQLAGPSRLGDAGGYFMSSLRKPVGSGAEHMNVYPPQDRGYEVFESAADEDQPGGQGESRIPGLTSLEQGAGEGKPLAKADTTGKVDEKKTSGNATGKDPPLIKEHPLSQEVDIGDPLSLFCRATGPGELSYMWYFNGLSIATETRPEYFINCFTDEDEGVYFCRVSNSWGTSDSEMARVRMKEDD